MSEILEQLAAVVGAGRILDASVVAERVTSFWDDAPMQAAALVQPSSTEQVSAVLGICHAARQSVVVQGGRTNLVSAAVPTADDIVLSLEKMQSIEEVDAVGLTAVVQAGAILQNVQEAVAEQGLYFPLDLGARGSCTIGGNIATNAGGINVLRYGMMRSLVLGVEAVLADGTVISSMNRMLKNNAGYDLKQLFVGTEGTLGIVTRAVLRLYPQPASRHTALVAMQDFDAVTAFLGFMQQRQEFALCAFEIMWRDFYCAMTEAGGRRPPLARDYSHYVIVQVEGSDAPGAAERFETVLGEALHARMIADAAIPKSTAEARAIWDIRESVDELPASGDTYHYDVSLPIRSMPAYVEAVGRNVLERWPDGRCYAFGHVADGNLHFAVQPDDSGGTHEASDECVYEPLREIGGSVSAEHGIGTEKLEWLGHSRTVAEIALMRTLKRNLDPHNILNPGRVVAITAEKA